MSAKVHIAVKLFFLIIKNQFAFFTPYSIDLIKSAITKYVMFKQVSPIIKSRQNTEFYQYLLENNWYWKYMYTERLSHFGYYCYSRLRHRIRHPGTKYTVMKSGKSNKKMKQK